jgi:hypothetical protein
MRLRRPRIRRASARPRVPALGAPDRRHPRRPAHERADAGLRDARPRRVDLIDLTHFMCSRTRCFPVVGGALVHKDVTHLTRVFARTLGPYLLRRLG